MVAEDLPRLVLVDLHEILSMRNDWREEEATAIGDGRNP
jgi:hypothetical protein